MTMLCPAERPRTLSIGLGVMVLAGVLALGLLAGGCGGGDNPESDEGSSATALDVEGSPVDGIYVARFSGEERSSPSDDGPQPGKWQLKIEGDSLLMIQPGGGSNFSLGNPVDIGKGGISFSDESSFGLCAGDGPAEYAYQLEQDSLDFRLLGAERCDERETLLSRRTWTPVSGA